MERKDRLRLHMVRWEQMEYLHLVMHLIVMLMGMEYTIQKLKDSIMLMIWLIIVMWLL